MSGTPPNPQAAQAATPRGLAVIVGASRGLGLLIARELGRQGYRVAICARDAAELVQAARILRSQDVEVSTEVCDVSDPAAIATWVDSLEREIGPVEVCICVAGIIQVGPWASLRRDHFTEALDVMLWGPINVAQAVVDPMVRRGRGQIGIITSVGGLISAPHLLPYSTAKFGAVGFSRGLRSELSGTGVTVTTVAPGLMRTGSHLRAYFLGEHGREYAWFATAASMPLLSMDAERAAAKIVHGILAGRALVTLTPLAWLAPRADALLPGLSAAVLSFTRRRLPAAPTSGARSISLEGREAVLQLRPRPRRAVGTLTTLGERAARRFNQGRGAGSDGAGTQSRAAPARGSRTR